MASQDDDTPTCGDKNDIAIQQAKYISKICVHCKENPTVFLYRKDCVCWPCLEPMWSKRVKTNLFKSRPNRHERLSAIFGFTGSVSSVVLLDILADALDEDRSDLCIVHIDISATLGLERWSFETNKNHHEQLKHVVEARYNGRWSLDIVPLEDLLGISSSDLFNLIQAYKEDITTQEDLLDYLIRSALITYARQKNFHRIITSQNASDLAVKAISSCGKGRGFQIAEECQIVENLHDIDMVFVLPLKDNLVDREIAHYYWKKKLQCVAGPKLISDSQAQNKSINGLTRSFMMSLQRGFDHTMHTVLRSVEKLSTKPIKRGQENIESNDLRSTSNTENTSEFRHRCILCTRVMSFDERNSSGLCFSCDKMLFKNIELSGNQVADNQILTHILNFNKDTVLAPAVERDTTIRQKQTKVTRNQMKAQIQDFLIEDNDKNDEELGASIFDE